MWSLCKTCARYDLQLNCICYFMCCDLQGLVLRLCGIFSLLGLPVPPSRPFGSSPHGSRRGGDSNAVSPSDFIPASPCPRPFCYIGT